MSAADSQATPRPPLPPLAVARRRPVAGRRRRPGEIPTGLKWLLAAMVFSAFLSGVKLVPGIGTNIGPFEICALLLIAYVFFHPGNRDRIELHAVSKILLLITVWAALSQLVIRPENTRTGLIQTMILANLFLVTTVLYNVARRYRVSPERLLTLITLAVLVVGPWVAYSGISSGGNIQAAGPFRNRAHVATYMLTSFWMVVIFLLLPAVRKRLRLAGYIAAASGLYAVAVSGRRSVYLSLFLGLLGISLAFVLARRGKRLRIFTTALFAVVFIGLFYAYGARLFPQASFFQSRVSSVGIRVKAFVAPSRTTQAEDNFYLLQRHGVMQAFYDSPVIGIGWGGFVRSVYSPTGHEVHSTPLRFLAELGIVGLLLYCLLLGNLLFGSIRLFLRMRRTAYSASYLALAVATWSLSVSYVYNRHITERTFWLFLGVFLTMQVHAKLVESGVARRAPAPGSLPGPAGSRLGTVAVPTAGARYAGRHHRAAVPPVRGAGRR